MGEWKHSTVYQHAFFLCFWLNCGIFTFSLHSKGDAICNESYDHGGGVTRQEGSSKKVNKLTIKMFLVTSYKKIFLTKSRKTHNFWLKRWLHLPSFHLLPINPPEIWNWPSLLRKNHLCRKTCKIYDIIVGRIQYMGVWCQTTRMMPSYKVS